MKTCFFHFSSIKDKVVKEKLNDLKRGVVYVFYTSTPNRGKRKVNKIWLQIKDIDPKLIPPFVFKIIDSFNGSKTNPYELAHVVLLLREADYFNKNNFEKLLKTTTIKNIPSIIRSMLSETEIKSVTDLDDLMKQAEENEAGYNNLCNRLIEKLY
jgi:hypothetical protein